MNTTTDGRHRGQLRADGSLDGRAHRAGPGTTPMPKQQPRGLDAKHGREGDAGRRSGLFPAGKLLRDADSNARGAVDVGEAGAGYVRKEQREAGAGGVDPSKSGGNHGAHLGSAGTRVVKDDLPDVRELADLAAVSPIAPSDADAVRQHQEIAARIRAHCDEHGIAPRQISLACGWDSSHLATVLRRLEAGRGTELGTLIAVARAMGRPITWLITGEMPDGVRLDSLPQWPEVSADAARIFGFAPDLLAFLGSQRSPVAPPVFDVAVLADLARGWSRATRRS